MRVPEAARPIQAWQERPEAGGRVATRLMRMLAFGLGRPLARFLTFFAALYFMIRRGPERAASRAYLERILGRRAGMARRLPALSVLLDRDARSGLSHGRPVLALRCAHLRIRPAGCGAEHGARRAAVVRPSGQLRRAARAEPAQSRRLDPHPARRGPEPGALRCAERAQSEAGRDHHRCAPARSRAGARDAASSSNATASCRRSRIGCGPANPAIAANFLGARAAFPASPWMFASALHVPVVLAFGLYRGGKRYDLHFERFAFELPRDRRERTAALAARGAALRGPAGALRAAGPLQLVQPLRFLGRGACTEPSSWAHCC